MAQFNKLPGFVEHLSHGVHDLSVGGDQLVIALSNVAPGSESVPPTGAASSCVLANITQISYTNLSSRNLSITGSSQTAGVFKLSIADLTLNSSGGTGATTGPFRYIYIYNDTSTSPADPLIGYYDYGASITLQNADSFTIDFDDVNGVLTLT